jgi:hypothetical protein
VGEGHLNTPHIPQRDKACQGGRGKLAERGKSVAHDAAEKNETLMD